MRHGASMRVLLFARARELAGADAVNIELAAGASVADVRRQLAREQPRLASLIERSALAVNNEYVDDHASVPVDADVALIPPVSGG